MRFNVDIEYNKANFSGFSNIYVTNIKVRTKPGMTFFHADSILFGVKPFALLMNKIRFSNISMYNSKAILSFDLLMYLQKHGNSMHKPDTSGIALPNYSETINKIQNRFSNYLPGKIILRNSAFYYKHDTIEAGITFENFSLINNKFVSDILFTDNFLSNECLLEGKIVRSLDEFTLKIIHSSPQNVKLPYLGPRWQACFGFDTLKFSGKINKSVNKNISVNGVVSAEKLMVYHKQIGPDTVVTSNGLINYKLNFGKNFIELDSSSVVTVNRFNFSPYFRFEKDTSDKIIIAFINKEFEANDLFTSLPKGLFSNFTGLETAGRLAFRMNTKIDLSLPDSCIFDAALENKGFKIKKFGVTDFRYINHPFKYEIYDNDHIIDTFTVGSVNPDFTPLNDVSPYLKYSILTSEDGDFFYHKGFNQKAFSESIAKNIKEKRFARGGSTITMQLVKNIFLNRRKTISRKIEEALIVWMIENLNLSTKERMFEVYLNIIEWGPGIYGIKPAANFYFDKDPVNLTLSESIYLSSLIPRPKGFKYTFDKNGKLRDYFNAYYQLLSSIMLRRNQITPTDTLNLIPIAELTGEAKKFLSKPDSMEMEDSLYFLRHDFFKADKDK